VHLAWVTAIIALRRDARRCTASRQERKDHALLFVLSLPLSPASYVRMQAAGPAAVLRAAVAAAEHGGAIALVLASTGQSPTACCRYVVLLCVPAGQLQRGAVRRLLTARSESAC
jgi:hypothetical protein